MVFVVCQVTLMCWGGSGGVVSGGGGVVLLPVGCLCTTEKKLKEVFSTGGKTREPRSNRTRPASELPWNLWEFHLSDVGLELPHDEFFSRPLVSPKLWDRVSSGLVSISSAALPRPPLLRLMNISSSRRDGPPPARRSYSQTRSELSVPITFRDDRVGVPRKRVVSVSHYEEAGCVFTQITHTSFSSGIQGKPGFHLWSNNNHSRGPHYQLIDWW